MPRQAAIYNHSISTSTNLSPIAQSKQHLTTKLTNKRAQRALDRSPEEKVKGHSGANTSNRDPQGHNFNNFGKGPFDDAIYYI